VPGRNCRAYKEYRTTLRELRRVEGLQQVGQQGLDMPVWVAVVVVELQWLPELMGWELAR